ncbi:MAG: PASTA domain-containing protein [Alphaproteobacteria bacterium]|nr:PASTA domain-containing protein [Alphaproteobacteria bacterium]
MASAVPKDDAALAALTGLDPAVIAVARVVLNRLCTSPMVEDHRLALLLAVTEGEGSDLGETLGRAVLRAGPVNQLTDLLAVRGIGPKRLALLAHRLGAVDTATFRLGTEEPEEALALARAQLAAADAEIALLNDEIARLRGGQGVAAASADAERMTLRDLASSAGSQVRAADDTLREGRAAVRLGAVTVALKGVVAAEGEQLALRMPREDDGVTPVSEVVLRYQLAETAVTDAAAGDVPDLVGYTEVLARRKAEAAGFSVDVAWEHAAPVRGQPSPTGRVLRQSPAAGTTAAGRRIRVFVGR